MFRSFVGNQWESSVANQPLTLINRRSLYTLKYNGKTHQSPQKPHIPLNDQHWCISVVPLLLLLLIPNIFFLYFYIYIGCFLANIAAI